MSYAFGGQLYRNKGDFHAAIAEAWITANGANDQDYIVKTFAGATDQQLAVEAIEAWNLDDDDEFDVDELEVAFEQLRADYIGTER